MLVTTAKTPQEALDDVARMLDWRTKTHHTAAGRTTGRQRKDCEEAARECDRIAAMIRAIVVAEQEDA
jgi:hypothetical protein